MRAGGTASAVVLAVLLAGCRRGEPTPRTPTAGGLPAREPVVSIGIAVDSPRTRISAPVAFDVRAAGGGQLVVVPAGVIWTFTADSSGHLVGRAGDGQHMGPLDGLIRVTPRAGGTVQIDGRAYRGEVLLRAGTAGHVTAANVLDLEEYLLGVVPLEMGHRPAAEMEALKAQAVAARTYAVGNMGSRQTLGFDFFATDRDQVYGGLAGEDTLVDRAVRETQGEIVTYQGQPIQAYYSSTCGGRTAAVEESWPWKPPQPYLKSVSDRIPGTDAYYCDASNRFRWSASWTRDQLLSVLGTTLRAYTQTRVARPSRVDSIALERRNASDRVTVRLTADGRSYVIRDDSIRWVLRTAGNDAILNSSMILDLDAHSDGRGVTELTIRGGGWGHGVGMCQMGAMGRARAGQSYRQILQAYYTGTKIERLY